MCTKSKDFYLACALDSNYKVIALSETWLHKGIYDAELFNLALFIVFRKDRDYLATGRKRGGGVLLAIDSNVDATLVDTTAISKVAPFIDVVLDKISTNNLRTTYIVVNYIPPSCDLNTVNIFFDWLLSLDLSYR